jgi:hypothetical protein
VNIFNPAGSIGETGAFGEQEIGRQLQRVGVIRILAIKHSFS